MAKYWTVQENKYIEEKYLHGGMTCKMLSNHFIVSQSTMQAKIRDLGLKLSKEEAHKRYRQRGIEAAELKAKKKRNPFPGASIDVIVYMAFLKNKKGIMGKRKGSYELHDILRDMCAALQLNIEDVRGEASTRELVICRYLFCWIVKLIHPEKKHREISFFLGYKAHTMVTTAVKKLKEYFASHDAAFMDIYFRYRNNTNIYTKTKYKDHAF